LDADMILVAQAGALVRDADETVIATTNVRHLALSGYPLDSAKTCLVHLWGGPPWTAADAFVRPPR
jgi:hypothetical protein